MEGIEKNILYLSNRNFGNNNIGLIGRTELNIGDDTNIIVYIGLGILKW